jgi:uncharacterized membrane protein
MNAATIAADFTVPLAGAMLCVTPAVTRPTVQFGVRIPPERTGATVLSRQRRAYYLRTAVIGLSCTVAALLLRGHGSWWLPRIILMVEVAADLGCLVIARKHVIAAKTAEHWFAGVRRTVVADTAWRANPPRFPVGWLIPALAVMVATVIVGAVRYPGLHKPVVSAFGIVIGQLWVTVLWTALTLLIYHSRPDIEAADPGASMSRYRRFLAAYTKAMLALVAMINLTLLLAALQKWGVYHLSGAGSALTVLPFAAGVLALTVVALRAGQGGSRLRGAARVAGGGAGGGAERDDDRFWKAGLIYVNRDDPALMVGARFGVGWTFNFGNRLAWLIIGVMAAVPAGLAAILVR